jgi:hypothetical protein
MSMADIGYLRKRAMSATIPEGGGTCATTAPSPGV